MHKNWFVPELVCMILQDVKLTRADWGRVCLVCRLFWEYSARLLWEKPFVDPHPDGNALAVVAFLRQLAFADRLDPTKLPSEVRNKHKARTEIDPD